MKQLALLLVAILGATAAADVVNLKDGSRLVGDVKKAPDGYVVASTGGRVTRVPADAVKSIELNNPPTTSPQVAGERLASLRRSVESIDDIHKIIERYNRFIEQSPGTPAEKDARQDLALWQDRLQRGMVRAGRNWVTPRERAALQEKAVADAGTARKMIRDGRLNEAGSLIQHMLAEDPTNPSALYLKALLHYRQDQFIPARKALETVNALVPNHAPTLNNLAVIAFRQNQAPGGLAFYDQAMLSSPKNRAVLDNVAEAINSLSAEQQNTPIAQRVSRRFVEQDDDLARELSAQGLHRWGATWVTGEQLEQLRAAEEQVRDQLDSLAQQFDSTKVRIKNIDREIDETERAMRRLEASSYVRDAYGNIYQAVLPPSYSELQRDTQRLQRERQEQYGKLDALRASAKEVQRKLPVPKYSGIQRLIDVEGTPVKAPGLPTSNPTSLPVTPPTTRPLR